MISVFIGVIGSGKGHRQAECVKSGAVALDFKDALVDMASDLVGYDVRSNYDLFKETIAGMGTPVALDHRAIMVPSARIATTDTLRHFPQALTGRVLLQRLGTEVMRKRDPDYWAKQWQDAATKYMPSGTSIAVSDCRFYNEVNAVLDTARAWNAPFRFVFCDYKSGRYDATNPHESEAMAQSFLKRGYTDGQEIKL